MLLKKYKEKRNFNRTPEPIGIEGLKSKKLPAFVIQKHRASHLHYDFRIEHKGVLKSWAVPKGVSMDPELKHLAILVEDHPLDYAKFEGIIPEGNYGAGFVEIWDEGYFYYPGAKSTSEIEKMVERGFNKGHVHIFLEGRKLRGEFSLIRIGKKKNEWLIFKQKHETLTEKLTEKIIDKTAPDNPLKLPKHLISKFPQTIKPMLAELTEKILDSDENLYEIKLDGYRIIAYGHNKKVKLLSRNGEDYTNKFPQIAAEFLKYNFDFVIDGEVVVLDKKGKSDFRLLKDYLSKGEGNPIFFGFDLLYFDKYDLKNQPLVNRKFYLKKVIGNFANIKYLDHIAEYGESFFAAATKNNLEGIIIKDKDSNYSPGVRSSAWRKVKIVKHQEAIIAGYTHSQSNARSFSALILAVPEGKRYRFIGKVGTGFSTEDQKFLLNKFKALIVNSDPKLINIDNLDNESNEVVWIKPKLVAQVKFTDWTHEELLRHPVYLGLRNDKSIKEIILEKVNKISKKAEKDKYEWKVDKVIVPVSNLDKIYWPEEKYTKRDLIEYYEKISPVMLPYLKDRPQSLNRHPDGINGQSFYHKDMQEKLPDWIATKRIYSESAGHYVNYMLCQNPQTLMYMANLGCIEINPWHSRVDSLDNPDYALFDLDPEALQFKDVVTVALKLRELLEGLNILSFVKTSGSRGIHIYVPTGAKYDYDTVYIFTKLIGQLLMSQLPELVSLEHSPDKRQGKVYIDTLRNRRSQTLAAVYSVRPKPGAMVSTPVKWEEVNAKLNPKNFTLMNTFERIDKYGDLWENFHKHTIDIQKVINDLDSKLINKQK